MKIWNSLEVSCKLKEILHLLYFSLTWVRTLTGLGRNFDGFRSNFGEREGEKGKEREMMERKVKESVRNG